MIEHKALHEWASWRDVWTEDDVEKALAYAGLTGWTIDHWSDGNMQFMHKGPVRFDDLAKLRITFTPRHMIVEAMVDPAANDAPVPDPNLVPLMVLVTMSWNVSSSDPEAV